MDFYLLNKYKSNKIIFMLISKNIKAFKFFEMSADRGSHCIVEFEINKKFMITFSLNVFLK